MERPALLEMERRLEHSPAVAGPSSSQASDTHLVRDNMISSTPVPSDNIQQSPAVWVHVHAALSERVTAIESNATFSGDITSRFVMLEKRVSSAEIDCAKKNNHFFDKLCSNVKG